jgi:hypothetical protein
MEVTASASAWCYASEADRAWWGDLWSERALHSTFAEQALAHGLAEQAELDQISDAWRRWAAEPDGWFAILHGEILCRA